MASGAYTHTHAYPYESPGRCMQNIFAYVVNFKAAGKSVKTTYGRGGRYWYKYLTTVHSVYNKLLRY